MAISYVGGSSAEGTTTSLPVGARAGDFAVVLAAADSNTQPGVGMGTSWAGANQTDAGYRMSWKKLAAADIAAGNVGVWTSASRVLVGVYRGVFGAGVGGFGSVFNDAFIHATARTPLPTDAWAIQALMHRAATDVRDRALTGYSCRSAAFASTKIGLWDRDTAHAGTITAAVNASGRTWSTDVGTNLTAAPNPPGVTTAYPETDAFWQGPFGSPYSIAAATGGSVNRMTGAAPGAAVWRDSGNSPTGLVLVGPGLLTIRTLSNDNTQTARCAPFDITLDGATVLSVPAPAANGPAQIRNHNITIPVGAHSVNVIGDLSNFTRLYFDGGEYGPLPAPTADFNRSVNQGDAPLSVTFTDASSGLGTLSRLWDFGDGTTSTATNPTHVFTSAGIKTVTLVTSNEGGSSAPVSKTVNVTTADPTTKPLPEFETSLVPTSTPAQVADWYLAYSKDASSAAFYLVERATDAERLKLDARARLYLQAAVICWPSITSQSGNWKLLASQYGIG